MAGKVYITDHNRGYSNGVNKLSAMEFVVNRVLNNDKSVIIGENITILPVSYIGNNSIICANLVVTNANKRIVLKLESKRELLNNLI